MGFEDFGYEVTTASNGKVGLEKFIADCPDLVLLDLHMPEMSGHDLLLKLDKIRPDIPKIVMSGVGII